MLKPLLQLRLLISIFFLILSNILDISLDISFFDFYYYVSNSSSWSEDSFGINVLLESSSSTEGALANYQAQNADAEAQLFSLIRSLERELSYGLPPQLNNGEYEQLV